MSTNLMSVAKITDHGFEVIFRKDDTVIIDSKGVVTTTATKRDGLYYVAQPLEQASLGREGSKCEKSRFATRNLDT